MQIKRTLPWLACSFLLGEAAFTVLGLKGLFFAIGISFLAVYFYYRSSYRSLALPWEWHLYIPFSAHHKGRHRDFRFLFLPVFYLLGFFALKQNMQERPAEILLSNRTIQCTVKGRLDKIEDRSNGIRLYLSEVTITTDHDAISSPGCLVSLSEPCDLRIGCTISVKGKASLLDSARNPGEFDMRKYYRAHGYDFTIKASEISYVSSRFDPLLDGLYQMRLWLGEGLTKSSGEENSGTLRGVLLGESNAMETEIKDLYRASGIAHLLSVSGMLLSIFV